MDKNKAQERQKKIWTDIVTLEGSPPKAEIYFWTHFKARRSAQVGELAELNEDAPTLTHDLEGRGCLSLLALLLSQARSPELRRIELQ